MTNDGARNDGVPGGWDPPYESEEQMILQRRNDTVHWFAASRAVVLAVVLLVIAGCPAPPAGTDNPDTGGMDGPVAPTTHRFTLHMRSGTGDRTGMEAYVVIDDAAYGRADAPYENPNLATRYQSGDDPDTFEMDVEERKIVTVIAMEFRGVTTSSELQDNSAAVEFLNFDGDNLNVPEAGVATVTMDGDREVSLVYATMPRFVMQRTDENNSRLSGGCFNLVILAATYLGRPGETDISGSSFDLCSNLSGYVKTGTSLTFSASDVNGCDTVSRTCSEQFDHWTGSPALCGSERECTLVAGVDIDATAVWRDTTAP